MLVCHVRARMQMPVYAQDQVIFFPSVYCAFYDIHKCKNCAMRKESRRGY